MNPNYIRPIRALEENTTATALLEEGCNNAAKSKEEVMNKELRQTAKK